jgi:hypothetical protein
MAAPQNPALAPVDFNVNPPVPIIFVDTLLAAKPVRAKDGTVGAPRYGVNALIAMDHPQMQQMKDLIIRLAMAAFPDRRDPSTGQWSSVGLTLPLKSSDKEYAKGHLVLNAGKPERGRPVGNEPGALLVPPRLWTINGGKYVQFDGPTRPAFAQLVWDGVLASLAVQFKAYLGMGGGVTCYLNDVVTMNSGDKIEGVRADPAARFGHADSFAQYQGHVTAHDPAAGYTGVPASPAPALTQNW